MSDFTQKAGDSLEELEVRLIDRKRKPVDLSSASGVLIYVRNHSEPSNDIDGQACEIQDASAEEEYPQRVLGPDQTLEPGRYSAYFKVLYGSNEKRIPSSGRLSIEVEKNYE